MARIGSMRAARRAGISEAASVTKSNPATAAATSRGSKAGISWLAVSALPAVMLSAKPNKSLGISAGIFTVDTKPMPAAQQQIGNVGASDE